MVRVMAGPITVALSQMLGGAKLVQSWFYEKKRRGGTHCSIYPPFVYQACDIKGPPTICFDFKNVVVNNNFGVSSIYSF